MGCDSTQLCGVQWPPYANHRGWRHVVPPASLSMPCVTQGMSLVVVDQIGPQAIRPCAMFAARHSSHRLFELIPSCTTAARAACMSKRSCADRACRSSWSKCKALTPTSIATQLDRVHARLNRQLRFDPFGAVLRRFQPVQREAVGALQQRGVSTGDGQPSARSARDWEGISGGLCSLCSSRRATASAWLGVITVARGSSSSR